MTIFRTGSKQHLGGTSRITGYQVVVIQDEVSDLETDVDFLFDEQIIQDQRLFSLEQQLISINEDIESNLLTDKMTNENGYWRI